jgi:hypothetical protein
MNAQMLKKLPEQGQPSASKVVATNIVAFARVSAGYQDAVSALQQRIQHKQRVDPA